MKKILILLIILFLLNGIFINGYEEECIEDYAVVNGTKAEITSCNVIETREGDPLYIEFIKCPEITFPITYHSYDNKDGSLKIDRSLEVYPIKSNYLRFSNFKTLTYTPILRCYEKGVFKKAYEPHIKVYPPRNFPETPILPTTTTTIEEKPKSTTTTTIALPQEPPSSDILNIIKRIWQPAVIIIILLIIILINQKRGKKWTKSLKELVENKLGIKIKSKKTKK